MTRNPWFPSGTRHHAEIRLLCLPHAGAGATAYQAWGVGLDPSVAVWPVQPPGRQKRRGEPPFTRVAPLAKELARAIADELVGPYAMFGHSTGALCAFETIRELRATGGPLPIHLFVSGRRAPQLPIGRDDLAAMDLPQLSEFLRRGGGTPEEILADRDVLRALQPLLAADYAVNQCYEYRHEPPLDISITGFAGVDDTGADPALTAPWGAQTTRAFVLHPLAGGHFAVFDRRAEVHTRIAADLLAHRRPTGS